MAKKKVVPVPKTPPKPEATVDDLVGEAQTTIKSIFASLGDEDYIEAMNQLEDFCSSCVTAKEEEMIADDEEDAADDEKNED